MESIRHQGSDQGRHQDESYRRIEVITGAVRRRRWTADEKAQILMESLAPGAQVSEVARRHNLNRGLLQTWRRQAVRTEVEQSVPAFVPVCCSDDVKPSPAALSVKAPFVPPAVIYRYAEDRRGRHVKEHLDGFHGVLQVDGYTGHDRLARPNRPGGPITLAYCLAHARREFFDVHKRTKDPVAAEALRRIGEIYAIEARIRGRPAEERVAIRQAETKPLMMALWSWLMQRLEEISTKSSLASAIRYTLGHWEGLTVFLGDGRVEVDNNTVERCIRPIPLGRKNALFAGSQSGGERWAILASLINTAKLHEIDPETYLADVLDRIVSGRTKVNALRELLPWNWKAARAAPTVVAA